MSRNGKRRREPTGPKPVPTPKRRPRRKRKGSRTRRRGKPVYFMQGVLPKPGIMLTLVREVWKKNAKDRYLPGDVGIVLKPEVVGDIIGYLRVLMPDGHVQSFIPRFTKRKCDDVYWVEDPDKAAQVIETKNAQTHV